MLVNSQVLISFSLKQTKNKKRVWGRGWPKKYVLCYPVLCISWTPRWTAGGKHSLWGRSPPPPHKHLWQSGESIRWSGREGLNYFSSSLLFCIKAFLCDKHEIVWVTVNVWTSYHHLVYKPKQQHKQYEYVALIKVVIEPCEKATRQEMLGNNLTNTMSDKENREGWPNTKKNVLGNIVLMVSKQLCHRE